MTHLIEAEGVTPQRRDRLAGAYNRGYLGISPPIATVPSGLREAIDRFIEQGQRLARDLGRPLFPIVAAGATGFSRRR